MENYNENKIFENVRDSTDETLENCDKCNEDFETNTLEVLGLKEQGLEPLCNKCLKEEEKAWQQDLEFDAARAKHETEVDKLFN